MVLVTLPILAIAAVALLLWHLQKRPSRRNLWAWAIGIGLGMGTARAVGASLGWYVAERTGGPMQSPAYALAMLAWPEAAFLDGRRVTREPPEFFVTLSLLLIASTTTIVAMVALVADLLRKHRPTNAEGRTRSGREPGPAPPWPKH